MSRAPGKYILADYSNMVIGMNGSAARHHAWF